MRAGAIILRRDTLNKILNIVFFQISWFSCLLLEQRWSLMITIIILLLHHVLIVRSSKEWLFISFVALLGSAADMLFGLSGVLDFPEHYFLIPVWLVCIWLTFATTLNHGFDWLKNHLCLAACLGSVGGPASYLAGAALTDVSFASSFWYSILPLATFWAVFFPASMYAAKKMLPVKIES